MLFGLQADVAVILVVFLTTLGFAYSLRYLYKAFWFNLLRGELITLVGLELVFLMIVLEAKFYDMSTAFLFTLGLGLLARNKFFAFYFLYPLACLNRETTFLMTLIFVVYFFRRINLRSLIKGIVYQVFIYIVIRLCLMAVFADVPGSPFLFRATEHMREFINLPWETLEFLGGVTLIVWLCLRNWEKKPLFLRTAFIILAPLLMMMFILFGWGFEIRVFVEIYAVVVLLAQDQVRIPNLGDLQA